MASINAAEMAKRKFRDISVISGFGFTKLLRQQKEI